MRCDLRNSANRPLAVHRTRLPRVALKDTSIIPALDGATDLDYLALTCDCGDLSAAGRAQTINGRAAPFAGNAVTTEIKETYSW